jgi:hypothetical protein
MLDLTMSVSSSIPDGSINSASIESAVTFPLIAVQTSPYISNQWKKQRLPIIAAFTALKVYCDAGTDAPATTYEQLAQYLSECMRSGAYKHMEAELPMFFASTGKPHQILSQLLSKLEIRLPPAVKNNNSQPQRATPNKSPPPSTISPSPLDDPELNRNGWFTRILSNANLQRIGNSNAHSLQLLLLRCVATISTSAGVPQEQEKYAREILLPIWITIPSVAQLIITTYHINLSWPEQRAYFLLLQQAGHVAEAASFIVHMDAVKYLDPVDLLTPLLRRSAPTGSDSVAVDLAESCPSLRAPLVHLMHSVAHNAARSLKLISRWHLDPVDFPDITFELANKQIRWLVREGKAEELGADVCTTIELKKSLIQELLLAGETDVAVEMMNQFNLQSDPILAEALHQRRLVDMESPSTGEGLPSRKAQAGGAHNKGPFLQLPPEIPVTFVTASNPASLDAAEHGLSENQTDLVGLDCEFGFTASSSNAPALLQVATRHAVFLFDLLSFNDSPRMGSILSNLFRSASIRKIGYAWDGDWSVLRGGFPGADAFSIQRNVLDLADPARALDRLEGIRDAKISMDAAAEEAKQCAEAGAAAGIVLGTAVTAVSSSPSPDDDIEMADDCDEYESSALAVAAQVAGDAAAAAAAASDPSVSPATPSRFDRRRAKKLAKKVAKSPMKHKITSPTDPSAPITELDLAAARKGQPRGLSALTLLCCGLPLDKFYQISAWRRRPLKSGQIHYAALDAYVEILIYDRFFPRNGMEHTRLPLLNELGLTSDPEQFVKGIEAAPSVHVPIPSLPTVVSKELINGVRPCPIDGCTLAVAHALSLPQCPLHTCIQCRGIRSNFNRDTPPLCEQCSNKLQAACARKSAAASAAAASSSALLPSVGCVPSVSSVPSAADPLVVVPWSDRCRHTSEEVLWTPATPPHAGKVCGNRAIVGAVYCQLHVCQKCLGAFNPHPDIPALYPCCTALACRWPNLASLQSAIAASVPFTDRNEMMQSISRLIIHSLPEPCLLYGGFVRDYLFRNEPANDLDVVICPKNPVSPASSEEGIAEKRRSAHALPCVETLISLSAKYFDLIVEKQTQSPPNGTTNLDFLHIVVLRPRDSKRSSDLGGGVQIELCMAGAYAAGEVDADVNNLAVGGGVSILPRDAHVPFSPPHAIRHILAKEFAYVRQAGWKLGLRRLWKLHWRGWKKVATIPWNHPAALPGNAHTGLAGTEETDKMITTCDTTKMDDNQTNNYKVPPWAVCPAARLEMGV